MAIRPTGNDDDFAVAVDLETPHSQAGIHGTLKGLGDIALLKIVGASGHQLSSIHWALGLPSHKRRGSQSSRNRGPMKIGGISRLSRWQRGFKPFSDNAEQTHGEQWRSKGNRRLRPPTTRAPIVPGRLRRHVIELSLSVSRPVVFDELNYPHIIGISGYERHHDLATYPQ
jgi:hypothetical protein